MRTRRSQDERGLVVHHNVALMVCEDPAVLEEILMDLDLGDLSVQRIGARALLVPSQELLRLRAALQDRGIYPKVMGEPVDLSQDDEPLEEDE
jgi:hypothetical protein